MQPDECYRWYSWELSHSLWRFACDLMRGMSRCQTTKASVPADTGIDVEAPKEKPRPPCEAVYKSTIETEINNFSTRWLKIKHCIVLKSQSRAIGMSKRAV